MAIRVQLDRILLERRMSLTELADRVGVTLANLLKHARALCDGRDPLLSKTNSVTDASTNGA